MNLATAMPRLAASAARIALLPPELLISIPSPRRARELSGRGCHPPSQSPRRPLTGHDVETRPQSCVTSRNAAVAFQSQTELTVPPMADLFQDYPFGRAW